MPRCVNLGQYKADGGWKDSRSYFGGCGVDDDIWMRIRVEAIQCLPKREERERRCEFFGGTHSPL